MRRKKGPLKEEKTGKSFTATLSGVEVTLRLGRRLSTHVKKNADDRILMNTNGIEAELAMEKKWVRSKC